MPIQEQNTADNSPSVSVVIPVKNDAAGLAACLDGILSQTVTVKEIIVIDSGSLDGTQKVALSRPKTRLIEIDPGDFNHGMTRDYGWRQTSSEFVLFTVQDARPYNRFWIKNLLEGFVSDGIAAVWGDQVVLKSRQTNPMRWFRPVSKPIIEVFSFTSPSTFDAASPETRRSACGLDNVTALYRRSALQEIGFRHAIYGEDILFARDAYRADWALVRNPSARVYHHHLENYDYALKQTIVVCCLRWTLFGVMPDRPLFRPVHTLYHLVRRLGPVPGPVLRWWHYNREVVRGIQDGLALLDEARKEGGDAMTRLHERFGGTPPVPLKAQQEDAA